MKIVAIKFAALILLFMFLVGTLAFANVSADVDSIGDRALELGLDKTHRWKSLLHVDGGSSIVDDERFFLSENGKNDIGGELGATIRAFFDTSETGDRHAICKFPARFQYISKSLNLDENIFPKVECGELKSHVKKISPQKISLSFASENITSPMSMMGHMFIKVSGYDAEGKLVEHALSYFAQYVKGESEFKFYFDSMFGGSRGIYFLTPYREKLVEYNDKNNRNVWNYDLRLTEEQALEFVYHMWELKGIVVPYNFFMHNCGTASIHMLASVDNRFYGFIRKFWMTPLDALKKMYGMGMIGDISLYPSDSYRIKMFEGNFTSNEKKEIKKFVLGGEYDFADDNKNNMLFMSDIVAGNYFLGGKITLDEYRERQKTIGENFDGVFNVKLEQVNKIQLNNPFSSGFDLSYGRHKKDNVLDLSFYPVYRSLTDDSSQNFNDFALELFKVNAFYDFKNDKIYLKSFDAINVKSLNPSSYLLPTWSFSFNVGVYETDYLHSHDLDFKIEGGIGKTYALGNMIRLYFMLYGGYFEKPYFMPEVGAIASISNRSKTILSYGYYVKEDRYADYRVSVSQNFYLNDRFAIHFDYEYRGYSDFLAGVKFYF